MLFVGKYLEESIEDAWMLHEWDLYLGLMR